MKLLFVLNIGFDKGGPSVHLLKGVIDSALTRGHACHVILKKTNNGELTGLEELTARHCALTVTLIEDVFKGKSGFVKRYLEDCRYALRCKREYMGNKYDAVFLQSCNVGWVFIRGFRRLKCPVIFNIQDIFPQNLMLSGQLPLARITYPLFSYLQKAAYKRATRLITISEDMKQTLAEQGIEREKIEVVYNWSYADDPIRLSDMPAERIFDLKADCQKTNVVYAGNIGKMQNVELVAKTAKLSEEDSTVHYYIIGDGASKKRVASMVEGLPNVTLLPMQPAVYAESIYAQADINVIPLAKGGIKTALPSKTATVLRTDTNVVFCIDAGFEFEQMVKAGGRVHVADNVDPASLYSVICDLRDGKSPQADAQLDLMGRFSKKNAQRYVEIMESAVGDLETIG